MVFVFLAGDGGGAGLHDLLLGLVDPDRLGQVPVDLSEAELALEVGFRDREALDSGLDRSEAGQN